MTTIARHAETKSIATISNEVKELAARNGEIYAVNGGSGENLDQLPNAQGRRDCLHGWTLWDYCCQKKSSMGFAPRPLNR